MKRAGISLLLVFTILATAVTSSAAAVQAGKKCKQVGTVKIVADKQYKCVLNNGKKVWSTPKPLKALSLDNLDARRVRAAAYSEIFTAVTNSTEFEPAIEFHVGPSVTKAQLDREQPRIERAAGFWSDIWTAENVVIAYFDYPDAQWAAEHLCADAGYCPPAGVPSAVELINSYYGPGCSFATTFRTIDNEPFMAHCQGGNFEITTVNVQTGAHEYTHWVQDFVSGWDGVPAWWVEGSAYYFGSALGTWDGSKYPEHIDMVMRDSYRSWWMQNLCDLNPATLKKIETCFHYTYEPGGWPTATNPWGMMHVAYYMGALATEALVAIYGVEVVKAFMIDIKPMGFELAFEENFGISTEIFYKKVSKYVLAMEKAGL